MAHRLHPGDSLRFIIHEPAVLLDHPVSHSVKLARDLFSVDIILDLVRFGCRGAPFFNVSLDEFVR